MNDWGLCRMKPSWNFSSVMSTEAVSDQKHGQNTVKERDSNISLMQKLIERKYSAAYYADARGE